MHPDRRIKETDNSVKKAFALIRCDLGKEKDIINALRIVTLVKYVHVT